MMIWAWIYAEKVVAANPTENLKSRIRHKNLTRRSLGTALGNRPPEGLQIDVLYIFCYIYVEMISKHCEDFLAGGRKIHLI